jgi:4-diphosphocytidyl-2-C-methyl-D-erythritol kinase
MIFRALAPAKVNLGLFVGEVRASDGRHELATVMQSISLADELALGRAAEGACEDELDAPGLHVAVGENLALRALAAFRAATGWRHAPLRVELKKRIPVAAGLGGGSADAACVLRLCAAASGLGSDRQLAEIAQSLGADVPAQLSPGRWLATGAGERLCALPDPDPPLRLLVLPLEHELSTARVYAAADEAAQLRSQTELSGLRDALAAALGAGRPLPEDVSLLHNDLEAAASSLCPQISDVLARARAADNSHAFVSGSGPTVIAVRAGVRADGVDGAVGGDGPQGGHVSLEGAIAAESVGASFGAVSAG